MALIPSLVAAQTVMRKAEEARQKEKEKEKPRGIIWKRSSHMSLTKEEIGEIATTTADEVMARVREREQDSFMLHSIPYAYGSPGIVVDEAKAKATPCRCIEYKLGKKLCFSKGIVGALSDEQEEIYCPTVEALESPGLEKRLKDWRGAVEICKAEIAEIPKGERLEPWLKCMSRELAATGVEA